MKNKQRRQGYIVLILLFLAILGLSFFYKDIKHLFSPELIREIIINAGAWGIFVFIVILLASVILPIPSTPVVLIGGFIYGLITGSAVSLFGLVLGSLASFWLIKKYGQPLIEKMVDKHQIIHFNHVFKKRGWIAVFISYAIPLFPTDSVSLLLGLTRMSYKSFLTIVTLGHIPRVLLINSLGGDLRKGFGWDTAVILILTIIFLLIAIFRERLKKMLFKELKEVESEVIKAEIDVEKNVNPITKSVGKDIDVIEEELGWRKKIIRRLKDSKEKIKRSKIKYIDGREIDHLINKEGQKLFYIKPNPKKLKKKHGIKKI